MPLMDLGDATIHYEVRGSSPLTLVFCHGLGGSGEGFERDDMDWYAQYFRTISWDNRGLGRSAPSAKYSLPLYAADLAGLLRKLGVEKAVVMGVSWGGVVVQRFALDYPEMCSAIVLDSTSSETNPRAGENWYLRGELARLGPAALDGKSLAPAFEGHATVSAASVPAVKPEHVESYVAQSRATASLREHPMTPYLSKIDLPTLVVAGGKDQVAGAGGSVIISRLIPGARLEILQEAGHGVYRQAPAEFRAILLDFLRQRGLMA